MKTQRAASGGAMGDLLTAPSPLFSTGLSCAIPQSQSRPESNTRSRSISVSRTASIISGQTTAGSINDFLDLYAHSDESDHSIVGGEEGDVDGDLDLDLHLENDPSHNEPPNAETVTPHHEQQINTTSTLQIEETFMDNTAYVAEDTIIGRSEIPEIDESLLNIIDDLGDNLEPNDEIEIEVFPSSNHGSNENIAEVFKRHSITLKKIDDMDFLSVDMSSIDEAYDDQERFRNFYGIDSAFSSESVNITNENNMADSTVREEEPEILENTPITLPIPSLVPLESTDETIAENDEDPADSIQQLSISEFPSQQGAEEADEESLHGEGAAPSFITVEQGTSLDNRPMDPPPYSEIDHFLTSNGKTNQTTLIAPTTPQKSNAGSEIARTPSSAGSITSSSSKSRRKVSIKVKKNQNGEVSRHASVDYYHLDRYLPPYRSLINPKKAYDYRTNTYINTADNDIIIRSGEDHKPIVSIHKRKRDSSKLVSILLNTNNNIKQKILDVTGGDNSSIRSRAVSIKSLTQSLHSSDHKEHKYKATAQFKDLPPNAHQLIIKHVNNQRDWVNCLYVSHSFHDFTIPCLYENPYFTSTYRLGQFLHVIMQNEELASRVKVFNLSHIAPPVILTKEERRKYHGRIEYGTSAAIEILNDKKKIAYAGWRDWKYRNHPLYGDSGTLRRRRASSTSTISSSTSSLTFTWEQNQSAPNLLEVKKSKSSTNNRGRSNSASDSSNKKAVRGTRERSRSTSNSGGILEGASNNNSGSFKTLKKALGLELSAQPIQLTGRKKKESSSPTRRSVPKSQTLKTTSKNASKMKTAKGAKNPTVSFAEITHSDPQIIPFGTPHPRINIMLKPYCFHRDIPAGYIIHVLKECVNLEEVNLNGIVICNEYEFLDYESFDWSSGSGRISHNGSNVGDPFPLDESRPIFWSDTGRDMDMDEDAILKGYVRGVSFKNVWEALMGLKHIKKLELQKINSIEQSIIEKFITSSAFKDTLKYMDCSNSGMVKREEWNQLFKAYEWKDYFRSESA